MTTTETPTETTAPAPTTGRYRFRHETVEAIRYTTATRDDVIAWLAERGIVADACAGYLLVHGDRLTFFANVDDWLAWHDRRATLRRYTPSEFDLLFEVAT